ncbi:unnamed protein product [Arabidopsis thaliana]|nr:unnamed protein product [Arabidopsis thaliana]
MNQSAQNYFSGNYLQLETSSGPYTSPPPIGYPTRDAVVGDPPAAAVETNSKGVNPEGCCAAICCCCVLDACF